MTEVETIVPPWLHVWKDGMAPQFSMEALLAIERGLEKDDPRILQGATTSPPPLECVRDWPIEATCLIGYGGWQGYGLETVAEVEEFFARVCFEADQRLGEPAACRWFLNHWDDTPRGQVIAEMLIAVRESIAQRNRQMQEPGDDDDDVGEKTF